MKILFIGAVEFSYKSLEKLIDWNAEIVGVCTKKVSNFNSDFADLTPLCNKANIPLRYVDNINSNESIDWIKSLKPDIIFCCADDSTGNLIKLLISKLPKYNYTLFLTGYSQEELIVYHITKENQQVFLSYFNEQPYLLKTQFISHNTGTIAKGLMSASLAFNTLIKSFYLKVDDILFFNFRLNTIYTQNLRYLNLNEFVYFTACNRFR